MGLLIGPHHTTRVVSGRRAEARHVSDEGESDACALPLLATDHETPRPTRTLGGRARLRVHPQSGRVGRRVRAPARLQRPAAEAADRHGPELRRNPRRGQGTTRRGRAGSVGRCLASATPTEPCADRQQPPSCTSRTSRTCKENTLHLFALTGGWPGAWAAQRLLRHKSSKRSFLTVYRVTVAVHCAAVLAWVFWLAGPLSAPCAKAC